MRLDTSLVTGSFDSPEPGTGRPVAIGGLQLSGTHGANYDITQPQARASINAVVPGAPTGVVATAGGGRATVQWSPAVFTGGSAITGYVATAEPGGPSCTWVSGPMECAVTGLANGTSYAFRVRAINAVGQGPASDASASITPAASQLPSAAEHGAPDEAAVRPDGSATVQVGCAASARACTATVTLSVGHARIGPSRVEIAAGRTERIAMALPPAVQRRLAAQGVLKARVLMVIEIDGSTVRVESTIDLTAPPATLMWRPRATPVASHGMLLSGVCRGPAVSRCDGTVTFYGTPARVRSELAGSARRVVVARAVLAGPAGRALSGRARLSAAGVRLLRKSGAIRVTPTVRANGSTKVQRTLPSFVISEMDRAGWLRRALATLRVGGTPRADLNRLLDQVKARQVSRAAAADQIEQQIIPARQRARARAVALPAPDASMHPIATLLVRAFDQSLAANRAYVEWLRSGQPADTRAWHLSMSATGTKEKLVALLARAGKPHGIAVPKATGLWP